MADIAVPRIFLRLRPVRAANTVSGRRDGPGRIASASRTRIRTFRWRPVEVWSIASFSALSLAGLLVVSAGTAQAATPVLLGTAADYAILAGSGITNTDVTTIVGDVGSSPTSVETGFAACPAANCVVLTGANHTDPDPNDAATKSAKTALRTAYNSAAGQTPTTIPTELAGQALGAGVYSSTSGTFGMTGTLVLDGANNPNAVFVFQMASTLITDGTGNVSLIRGAQSCNVFWQVGSAATLGAGSTLRGTILAHDDISLGDGVTVDGRLLAGEQASGAGAVTLIHDTVIRSVCATPPPPPTGTATAPAASTLSATVAPISGVAATATTPPGLTTPAGLTPPAGGPPQVGLIPRGPVQTGDGSTIAGGPDRRVLLAAGVVALAAAGATAVGIVRRRRN